MFISVRSAKLQAIEPSVKHFIFAINLYKKLMPLTNVLNRNKLKNFGAA
jgi:hypothetical protein